MQVNSGEGNSAPYTEKGLHVAVIVHMRNVVPQIKAAYQYQLYSRRAS